MSNVLDLARVQMGTVLTIIRRDLLKRLVVAALISAAAGHFAGREAGMLCAVSLIVSEAAFYLLVPPASPHEPMGAKKALTAFVVVSLSMVPWLLPSIILVAQPNQASQILGFFWACATALHIMAFYSMTVVLGWTSIGVHTAAFVAAYTQLYRGPVEAMSQTDFLVLTFFMGLWLWNAFEVMGANADNRKAFGEARFQAEERLKMLDQMANQDVLTGLMNRRAFDKAFSDILMEHDASTPLAVVLIDLDGFKPINDTYGHPAGDAVLIEIASRIADMAVLRSQARLGGDEFIALVPGIPEDGVSAVLDDLALAIAAPISHDGLELSVGASAGFAMARPGATVPQLVGAADKRMYLQKLERKAEQCDAPSAVALVQ